MASSALKAKKKSSIEKIWVKMSRVVPLTWKNNQIRDQNSKNSNQEKIKIPNLDLVKAIKSREGDLISSDRISRKTNN